MTLTETQLRRGARYLAALDTHLAQIHGQWGYPPLWARAPGFPTLIHIILEQQVSLASALAAFVNLKRACRGVITPTKLLRFDDVEMRRIGFSRQKAGYAREMAQAIRDRRFDPEALQHLPDEAVRETLIGLKGIGRWSADVYLIMALGRPDVWPHGDLALAVAVQEVMGLANRPTYTELNEMAEQWSPWRAVAARMFWHSYLSRRGRAG